MGELGSALDALAADDLDGLVASQYLDRTAMLVAARNRIDAELARTARRAELAQAPEYDGKKGMASWLRGHCRLSAAEASRVVRTGRTLERLPAVAAAWGGGPGRARQGAGDAPAAPGGNPGAGAAAG